MRPIQSLLFAVAVALFFAATALAHEGGEKLGQVHFPVSCNQEAQRQFDRALALLHSFWYAEAVKGFAAVTETDPACAMGYWGIAMSVWYPLWQPPSEAMLKKGAAAVEQAKTVGGKTEREQQYIAAIEMFLQRCGQG